MTTLAAQPRLVLFGVGFVGQALVRLADMKGWPIVAAYNRAGDKIGQDLGSLAGLDKDLGVVVQDCEGADYSALEADVALIAASDLLEVNYPAYEGFLNAGINVLCHGTQGYLPYWADEEVAETIDTLARKCGVTFTGGGIWDSTRFWSALVAAGPCVRIDSLVHRSNTEIVRQGVHFLPMTGVGMTEAEYDQKLGRKAGLLTDLLQIPSIAVLQKLGYTVSNVDARQEPIIWDETIYVPEMEKELEPGICMGTRLSIDVTTEQGITATSELEYRIFKPGEDEIMFWRINGLPGMEVSIKREDSGVASASSLFNRIPDVMAAEPGIQQLTGYAPLTPTALV